MGEEVLAKPKTIAVGGINIRVHSKHEPAEYINLWNALLRMRKAKIRGPSALMIGTSSRLNPSNPQSSLFGYLYRFVNIDPDDPWFNIDQHKKAEPEDVALVSIPPALKPNLAEIPYLFDVRRHKLFFLSGGTDPSVSAGSVTALMEFLCAHTRIKDRFGDIDTTTLTKSGLVEELLKWPEIRRIDVSLKRPNPTDFDDDQAFYERLKRRNLKEEQYTYLKAPGAASITPDEEMKAIFERAVENGLYEQTGTNPEGKTDTATSSTYPRKEIGEYDPKVQTFKEAFVQVISEKFGLQQ